jgi:hypothetical protein
MGHKQLGLGLISRDGCHGEPRAATLVDPGRAPESHESIRSPGVTCAPCVPQEAELARGTSTYGLSWRGEVRANLSGHQLLVEPFHSLQAALVRRVYEADAILIGGYGLADVHVNRALRNRLDGRPCEERPPIMALDYAGERTDPLNCRRDLWSFNLANTLSVDGFCFREAGLGSACRPHQLAHRQSHRLGA